MSIIHAGAESFSAFRNLTICGVPVPKPRAPLIQPVNNVTCMHCRKIIRKGINVAREQIIEGMGLND